MPIGSARLHELGEVVEVQVVRPEVREGVDADDGVEEAGGERQRPGVGVEREHAVLDPGVPDALMFSAALNHRSVAHTCTPNSRRRKMDDDARPQPRSKTLMPGRRSSAGASHSVSQSEFAPPLAFARTHSGWYCEARGNWSVTSRSFGVMGLRIVPQARRRSRCLAGAESWRASSPKGGESGRNSAATKARRISCGDS